MAFETDTQPQRFIFIVLWLVYCSTVLYVINSRKSPLVVRVFVLYVTSYSDKQLAKPVSFFVLGLFKGQIVCLWRKSWSKRTKKEELTKPVLLCNRMCHDILRLAIFGVYSPFWFTLFSQIHPVYSSVKFDISKLTT